MLMHEKACMIPILGYVEILQLILGVTDNCSYIEHVHPISCAR